jgi:hypothetical protein
VYSRTMSCLASRRALASSDLLAPVFARASISAHLNDEARPGDESHFLRRESLRVLSGRSCRRRSDLSSEAQGS